MTEPQIFPRAAILRSEAAGLADGMVVSSPNRDQPMVGQSEIGGGFPPSAAMNAILHFPTHLAAELRQLRCEVVAHRMAIEVAAIAFEQSQSAWAMPESDITRRMHTLRQRLARLMA